MGGGRTRVGDSPAVLAEETCGLFVVGFLSGFSSKYRLAGLRKVRRLPSLRVL